MHAEHGNRRQIARHREEPLVLHAPVAHAVEEAGAHAVRQVAHLHHIPAVLTEMGEEVGNIVGVEQTGRGDERGQQHPLLPQFGKMIVQFLDTIGDHPGRRMLGLKVVGKPGFDLEEQGIRKKLQHAGCHHPAPDTGQHHLIETGRQTPHFVRRALAKDRRRWANTARDRKPLQIAHENTRWNRIAPSASIQDTPPAGAASRRRNRDGRQLAQLRAACPIRPARDIPGRRNRRPLRPATYPCGKTHHRYWPEHCHDGTGSHAPDSKRPGLTSGRFFDQAQAGSIFCIW